jgi:hypothetical protein
MIEDLHSLTGLLTILTSLNIIIMLNTLNVQKNIKKTILMKIELDMKRHQMLGQLVGLQDTFKMYHFPVI